MKGWQHSKARITNNLNSVDLNVTDPKGICIGLDGSWRKARVINC